MHRSRRSRHHLAVALIQRKCRSPVWRTSRWRRALAKRRGSKFRSRRVQTGRSCRIASARVTLGCCRTTTISAICSGVPSTDLRVSTATTAASARRLTGRNNPRIKEPIFLFLQVVALIRQTTRFAGMEKSQHVAGGVFAQVTRIGMSKRQAADHQTAAVMIRRGRCRTTNAARSARVGTAKHARAVPRSNAAVSTLHGRCRTMVAARSARVTTGRPSLAVRQFRRARVVVRRCRTDFVLARPVRDGTPTRGHVVSAGMNPGVNARMDRRSAGVASAVAQRALSGTSRRKVVSFGRPRVANHRRSSIL